MARQGKGPPARLGALTILYRKTPRTVSHPHVFRAFEGASDHRHRLLCARHERPRGSRAAEQRDEFAAPHSITSSAATSRLSGTVRPSAFAVLRLMTNSYFVG